jgi:TatD DNase family protein
VKPIRNIHCHAPSRDAIYNVFGGQPVPEQEQMFSVGIHPWHLNASSLSTNVEELLKPYLKQSHCVAIGECGLDKLTDSELSLQITIFEQHIQLAEKYGLPLLIHGVKAFDELIQLRKKYPKGKWVLHGFSKKSELAKQLSEHEIMLSFGVNLRTKDYLQKAFQEIPLNSVFLETDMESPELISELYQLAAQLKSLPLKTFEREMIRNITSFFAHTP